MLLVILDMLPLPITLYIDSLFGIHYIQVIPLLSHHNEELTCEVLAFLKVILYSGNHEVQKHCVEVMRKREGGLFHTMQKMLHSAATIHRERWVI